MLESLESRRLRAGIGTGGGPAVGPIETAQSGGTLTIANAHIVQINDYDVNGGPSDPGDIYVYDKNAGTSILTVFHGVTTLIVQGTRDSDIISASFYNPLNAEIDGGLGKDYLTVGNNGPANVTINAGNGNDSIWADNLGTGTITAYGQGGRDLFNELNQADSTTLFIQ